MPARIARRTGVGCCRWSHCQSGKDTRRTETNAFMITFRGSMRAREAGCLTHSEGDIYKYEMGLNI